MSYLTREEIDKNRKQREEASAKADIEYNEYKKGIRPVEIVSIGIPFVDVLALTFQGFGASLIIAIPIAFIFYMIINS